VSDDCSLARTAFPEGASKIKGEFKLSDEQANICRAIAGLIHQSTTTPQGWTAERLQMKSAANVSQQLSRAKKSAKPKIKPANQLSSQNYG
jgi:hypothetical protein